MTDFLTNNNSEKKSINIFRWLVVFTGILIIVGAVIFFVGRDQNINILLIRKPMDRKPTDRKPMDRKPMDRKPMDRKPAVKAFTSVDEFRDYLARAAVDSEVVMGLPIGGAVRALGVLEEGVGFDTTLPSSVAADSSVDIKAPSRVASTNVQVKGIDEPDIIKTDGKVIYFSSQRYFRERRKPRSFLEGESLRLEEEERYLLSPPFPLAGIKSIKAWPPQALEVLAELNLSGEFLLADKMLVVIGSDKLIGVSVLDPKKMKKEWEFTLAENSNIIASRLYQGILYLISRSNVNQEEPCPLEPIGVLEGTVQQRVILPCREIYHPVRPVAVDSVFTVFKLDPQTGKVISKRALIGSSGKSVVYMSPQAIYLTYLSYGKVGDYLLNFFVKEEFLPTVVRDKLKRLQKYQLSDRAKLVELETVLNSWQAGLDREERLRIENELTNRISSYYKEHKRELESTGIVKVKVDNLTIAAVGEVPGELLNQFSLDEFQGYLRVATTIGQRGFWRWGMGREESVSDVYVLDKNLKTISSVRDLGKGERIYAVRFLGKRGYVVTFRQVDPFYIIDLSNPTKPLLAGELKIPGYSSYLHPLTADLIVGIGKEGSQVKISLFSVKDVNVPAEVDKYMLNEYYSEVLNNHRAFLVDEKNKIFFLPGGRGGYIFSFANQSLDLVRAISDKGVKRALYLDDYLYLVGQDFIVVFNQSDWQEVKRLEF